MGLLNKKMQAFDGARKGADDTETKGETSADFKAYLN